MDDNDKYQIFLNSKYATNYNDGTNNVDFFFQNIEVLSQYDLHISMKHCVIPYSFYNVNKTNKQLFIRLYNTQGFSQSLSFAISEGNHTISSLLTELQLLLGTSFTITYNSITNKLSFTHSTYEFVLLSSSSCLEIIGFLSNFDIYSINKTLDSTTCVNLQPVQCICISSNIHTNSINTSNSNNGHTLASIPINQPPFSMITFINNSNFRVNLNTNNLNMINIKMLDQQNNVIDLHGLHWTMTLQVDIIRFSDD